MEIAIGRKSERRFSNEDVLGMHQLRYRTFRQRLEWDVPTVDEMEIDQYDDVDPVYMLARDGDSVCGCWRLLPTTDAYMLRDTFSDLLEGQAPPNSERVWELSRFALDAKDAAAHRFSDAALAMIERVVEHALANGITQYVTVTTPAIERLLRRLGLQVRRFGPPRQLGVDKAVAFAIEIDDEVLTRVRANRAPTVPKGSMAS